MTNPDFDDAIDRIASLPNRLADAVKNLDDSQLDTPYRDGGWTVRQVVHHLVDAHINGVVSMKLILTEDHPTLKPYDQDAWADLVDTREGDISDSLKALDGLHTRWTRLLRSIDSDAWLRSAHHPEVGEVTLEALLHVYADHGDRHLGQITDLKRDRGW